MESKLKEKVGRVEEGIKEKVEVRTEYCTEHSEEFEHHYKIPHTGDTESLDQCG